MRAVHCSRNGECADSKRRSSASGETDEFAAMTSPAAAAAMFDSSGAILNPTVVNGVESYACPIACRCGYGSRSPAVASLYETGSGRGLVGCDTCAKLELVALTNSESAIPGTGDSATSVVGSVGPPYGSIWPAANGDCPDDVIMNTCYSGGSIGGALHAGPGSDPTSPLLYRQTVIPSAANQSTFFSRGRSVASGPRDVTIQDGGRTGRNYERGGGGRTFVASTLVAVNTGTACQGYESPKRRPTTEQQIMRLPPDVTSSLGYDVKGFQSGATSVNSS